MRAHTPLLLFWTSSAALASGHGPVFGLATPTNPRGGFSIDYSLMGRYGESRGGAMSRFTLGYGITEDLKVSVSAPAIHKQEPFAPSRVAAFTPMGANFEGLALWRFHRQDLGVGSRFESTLIAGVVAPGTQAPRGGTGGIVGGVTGYASRSHYVWGGATWQRAGGIDNTFWSAVYGYRPLSWRTDYPRWDWRVFGELTGDRTVGNPFSGNTVFAGPTTLGVYKNIAVAGGVQWAVSQSGNWPGPKERFRWSVSLAYFF